VRRYHEDHEGRTKGTKNRFDGYFKIKWAELKIRENIPTKSGLRNEV